MENPHGVSPRRRDIEEVRARDIHRHERNITRTQKWITWLKAHSGKTPHEIERILQKNNYQRPLGMNARRRKREKRLQQDVLESGCARQAQQQMFESPRYKKLN